ncbi:MAG TPA: oligosaccharide flippase family protein [Thermoleophilaceae bacterium]|nr:oligosaccharide flippase family protein [Thermoleophilaceae bacterium]
MNTPPTTPDANEGEASGSVARNALVRMAGEILAKTASVVFFILIARKLGEEAFGDFTFALSLTSVLLFAAGLGTEELTTREIARDRSTVHLYITNVILIKTITSFLLVVASVLIVVLGSYPAEVQLTVLLVGAGVAFENTGRSYWSAFQAFERQEYVSLSLIVQRFATLIGCIVVLVAGGGLVAVAAVFLGGAVLNLFTVRWALRRFVVKLRFDVDVARWWPIARAGLPIGVVTVLGGLTLRLDATLISFFTPGSGNAEVGYFGAAFRLVEATLFIGWGFNAAALPWLAQQTGDALRHGFELGTKAVAGLLAPIGVILCVLAEPIIELVYGAQYEPAVLPLRYLGLSVVAYSINFYFSTVLVARDKPTAFARAQLVALGVNVAVNAYVIPRHGAAGAAAVALGTGALLAVLGAIQVQRVIGRASLLRGLLSPTVAALAMAGVIELTQLPLVPAALLGLVVYGATALAVERVVYPDDLAMARVLVSRLRRRRVAALAD